MHTTIPHQRQRMSASRLPRILTTSNIYPIPICITWSPILTIVRSSKKMPVRFNTGRPGRKRNIMRRLLRMILILCRGPCSPSLIRLDRCRDRIVVVATTTMQLLHIHQLHQHPNGSPGPVRHVPGPSNYCKHWRDRTFGPLSGVG